MTFRLKWLLGHALLATIDNVFTGQPLSPDVLQFGTGEDG